ncbi:MAG: hypothetical protein ACE5KT_05330 [Methanosarcinales archaeon]
METKKLQLEISQKNDRYEALLLEVLEEIHNVRADFNRAVHKIERLIDSRFAALVERSSFSPEVMVMRSIPREEAKKEILDLFKSTPTKLSYSDIIDQLRIDPEVVIDIVDELEEEGLIGSRVTF